MVGRWLILAVLAGCAAQPEIPPARPIAACAAPPPPATTPSQATGLVPVWRVKMGEEGGRLLVDAAGGIVVSAVQGGRTVAVDLETGATCAVLVRAPGEGPSAIDPYMARSFVAHGALVGASRGRLSAIDLRTGAVRWSHDPFRPEDRSDEYALRDTLDGVDAGASIAVSFRVMKKDVLPFAFAEIVAALDPATGAEAWRRVVVAHPPGEPQGADGIPSLAAGGGRVLVRAKGKLVALDAKTGAEAWTSAWPAALAPMVAAGHGRVVIASADGRVQVLDARTGARVAEASIAGRRPTAVVVGPDAVLVAMEATPGSAEVVAVDTDTGAIRWRRPAAYSVVGLHAEGALFLSAEGDGRAWALDARTGEPRWGLTTRLLWDAATITATRAGAPRVVVPGGVLEAFDPPAGARPAAMDPYLRWELAGGPDGCAPEALRSIDGEERTVWLRALPDRFRAPSRGPCDLAELAAYRRAPRRGFPWYDGHGVDGTDDAWIVTNAGGVLVLGKRDGAVLLDLVAPPSDREVWFDQGTFSLSGDPPCQGTARGGRVFARCGDRFLFFNGSRAALIAPSPWRAEQIGTVTSLTRSPPGTAPRVDVTVQLGTHVLELHGVIFLR